jgi:hypothetical protein
VKRRQWNAAVRAAVGESRGNGEGAIRKVRARLPSRSAAINLRSFHGLSSGSERIFACAAFHCGKSSPTSALLSRLSQKRIGPMLRYWRSHLHAWFMKTPAFAAMRHLGEAAKVLIMIW